MKAGDVHAYPTATCEEKIWTAHGPEFEGDQGRSALIVCALYGPSSAGASHCRHLAGYMRSIECLLGKTDLDLWFKPMVREDDNGCKCYAYAMLYVDDELDIRHNAQTQLKEIGKFCMMKENSMGDPGTYLGTKLRRTRLKNDTSSLWDMDSSKHVKDAVKNVNEHLKHSVGCKLIQCKERGTRITRYYWSPSATVPQQG